MFLSQPKASVLGNGALLVTAGPSPVNSADYAMTYNNNMYTARWCLAAGVLRPVTFGIAIPGRPGIDLWISTDGFGNAWQRYSLPTVHNALVASEAKPAAWGFCHAFLTVAANHTYAGDPTPRADHVSQY